MTKFCGQSTASFMFLYNLLFLIIFTKVSMLPIWPEIVSRPMNPFNSITNTDIRYYLAVVVMANGYAFLCFILTDIFRVTRIVRPTLIIIPLIWFFLSNFTWCMVNALIAEVLIVAATIPLAFLSLVIGASFVIYPFIALCCYFLKHFGVVIAIAAFCLVGGYFLRGLWRLR